MYEQTGSLVRAKFREHLLPTIATTMALSLATVVDGIIVGQLLGADSLAAIGLASPVIYCINILYVVFGVGGMMCASIARGRWENEKADRVFTSAYLGGLIVTFLFVAVMWAFMVPICTWLASGDVYMGQLTAQYVRPLVFTAPALLFAAGMTLFMRADGKPKSSATVMVVANAVNLVLDYVLIAFFDTGVMGAGLSTTLGYVFGGLLVLPYLLNLRKQRTFRFVKVTQTASILKEVISAGLPKGLAYIAAFGRALVLNAIVMTVFGSMGMSVMTVLINVLTLATIFVSGTGDTLLPIVGTLYGEKDHFGIRQTVNSARNVLVAASIGIMAFFFLCPKVIAALFALNTPEALAMLVPALRMFTFYVPLYAAVVTIQNFYNTTGRTRFASTIAVLDGFVFVCAFALGLMYVFPPALWLCYAFGSGATLLTILVMGVGVRKKEGVTGLLLLRGENNTDPVWSMTIQSTQEQAAGLAKGVVETCLDHGMPQNLANRLGIAMEEIAVSIGTYAYQSVSGDIDVMIRVNDEDIVIRFRDNGKPFDPVEYTAPEDDDPVTDSVEVMKKMASEVTYSHQLGFNTTVLTFHRAKQGHFEKV